MDESSGQDDALSIDTEILGDIDAWNLRQRGDWFFFEGNLPHSDGVRGYRRQVSGRTILADAPGPVVGFLAIGGSRVAQSLAGVGRFPYHIVAPAGEVGAVGLAGVEEAIAVDAAEALTEVPQIALTANEYLTLKRQSNRSLPLIIARAEHDDSSSVSALRSGIAMKNLMTAARSISNIAATLEKRVSVLVVSLDFVLEDVSGAPKDWAGDMLALMKSFERLVFPLGYAKIHFVSVMENADNSRIEQQFRLGLFSKAVSFSWVAPSYSFERDHHYRATEAGMKQRAKAEAVAISRIMAGEDWTCPTLLLAEWDGNKNAIRVSTNATEDLMLDEQMLSAVGKTAGFAVLGATISKVKIDRRNRRELLISLTGDLPAKAELHYAVDGKGALRDTWTDNKGSHRWALPSRLIIGQNPANFADGGAAASAAQSEAP